MCLNYHTPSEWVLPFSSAEIIQSFGEVWHQLPRFNWRQGNVYSRKTNGLNRSHRGGSSNAKGFGQGT
jgi:hypothetical protein